MLLPYYKKNQIEAGCDEAGRGCLAGPVVAASVILPPKYKHAWLNDSKQLSEKKRDLLRIEIERDALAFSVSFVDHATIDQINILNASFLAMSNAVKQLKTAPYFLLIDGNRFKTDLTIPYACMIKGDARFLSIAAASILAKTYRDEYMINMHEKHPEFHWNKNKGYPTKDHRKAIAEFGPSPIHRMSFALLPRQLEITL